MSSLSACAWGVSGKRSARLETTRAEAIARAHRQSQRQARAPRWAGAGA